MNIQKTMSMDYGSTITIFKKTQIYEERRVD